MSVCVTLVFLSCSSHRKLIWWDILCLASFSGFFHVTLFSRQVKCLFFVEAALLVVEYCVLSSVSSHPVAEQKTSPSLSTLQTFSVAADGSVCGSHLYPICISWALVVNENMKRSDVPVSWSTLFLYISDVLQQSVQSELILTLVISWLFLLRNRSC